MSVLMEGCFAVLLPKLYRILVFLGKRSGEGSVPACWRHNFSSLTTLPYEYLTEVHKEVSVMGINSHVGIWFPGILCTHPGNS